MTVIDLQTCDRSNFKLGKSGRAVKLFYDKEPLQICTSTMYLPFGVKSLNKEWSNFSEYNIDCSLNASSSEVSICFRKGIEQIDNIIQDLTKQNLDLFHSKNERATSDFKYSNILRENGTYPKLMKLQLPRDKNGNFESFIFDENKQKIAIDEENIDETLSKGKTFKAIIECSKVWYFNGKVGSIWKVVQLKFSDRNKDENPSYSLGSSESNIYNQLMIED